MPLAWLVGVYLASLGSLLDPLVLAANDFRRTPIHVWNLDNYREFLTGDPVYRSIVASHARFAAVDDDHRRRCSRSRSPTT